MLSYAPYLTWQCGLFSALAAVESPKLFDSIIFIEPLIGRFSSDHINKAFGVIPGVFAKRSAWSSRYVSCESQQTGPSAEVLNLAMKPEGISRAYHFSPHGIQKSSKPTSSMALPKARRGVFASRPLRYSYVKLRSS